MHRDEVIKIVEEMLKSPIYLSKTDWMWVKRIDRTVGNFPKLSFTPRQYNVIMDIYKRFVERKEKSIERKSLKYKKNQIALLKRYHKFYRDLESGRRKAENDAQKHFILVCKGLAEPVTEHEKLYWKFIQTRRQIKKGRLRKKHLGIPS